MWCAAIVGLSQLLIMISGRRAEIVRLNSNDKLHTATSLKGSMERSAASAACSESDNKGVRLFERFFRTLNGAPLNSNLSFSLVGAF